MQATSQDALSWKGQSCFLCSSIQSAELHSCLLLPLPHSSVWLTISISRGVPALGLPSSWPPSLLPITSVWAFTSLTTSETFPCSATLIQEKGLSGIALCRNILKEDVLAVSNHLGSCWKLRLKGRTTTSASVSSSTLVRLWFR